MNYKPISLASVFMSVFCSVILHYTDEGYCKVAETSVLEIKQFD